MTPDQPSDPPVLVATIPARGAHPAARVAYTCEGPADAPTVLAVHGLPGSVRDFRWLGSALGDRVRLVRVDLPGSGATSVSAEPSPSARDRAALLVRFLDTLNLSEATIVGHSFGGAVVATAAADHPERFPRLGLLACVGRLRHLGYDQIPAPRAMRWLLATPVVRTAFFPVYLRGIQAAGFRGRYGREELAHMNAVIAAHSFRHNRDAINRLTVPTMVAWAEDDMRVDKRVSRDLAATCPPGPRLSWPDGGHNIQKTRASEIADTLAGWLSRA